jgi:hypothetical protein
MDKISAASPLGKGLLGKKVGEIVKLDVASGIIEYKPINFKCYGAIISRMIFNTLTSNKG